MGRFTPRVFAVAGSPGSGKDELIRAIKDLGVVHAQIVPKHTSRARRADDGGEMICPGDRGFDLEGCDIRYSNFGDSYGIASRGIWGGLANGVFQVAVVSAVPALNELLRKFGELCRLIYVHSEVAPEKYLESAGRSSDYAQRRAKGYATALEMYVENIGNFDHVLLHAGATEDLYDQIFRLFRSYEQA